MRAAFRVIRVAARQLAKLGAFEPGAAGQLHLPLAFALRHKLNVRMTRSLQADGLKTSVLRTGQLPTGRQRVLLSFA